MDFLLRFFLQGFVRRGSLEVTLADGTRFDCGDGTGKPVRIRFTTKAAQRHIVLDPEMAFGECCMDGTLLVENATITELVELVLSQPTFAPAWAKPLQRVRFLARHIQQFNSRRRSKRNVARHYDLDGRLYALFSIPTGNTAAPISSATTRASTTPSSPRNATWPPSF